MTHPDDGTRTWWACTRKMKYATQALAEEVAARQQRKTRKQRDTKLYPYPCEFCGCWHLSRKNLPWRRTA